MLYKTVHLENPYKTNRTVYQVMVVTAYWLRMSHCIIQHCSLLLFSVASSYAQEMCPQLCVPMNLTVCPRIVMVMDCVWWANVCVTVTGRGILAMFWNVNSIIALQMDNALQKVRHTFKACLVYVRWFCHKWQYTINYFNNVTLFQFFHSNKE